MLTQLVDLREYGANPGVRDLNRVALLDKHRHQKSHLAMASIRWPDGFEVGRYIRWEVHHTKDGCVSGWRSKRGRIMAVGRWFATVDAGKYRETILLKDLYIGRVRMV